jgi:hypothetical protein
VHGTSLIFDLSMQATVFPAPQENRQKNTAKSSKME